MNNCKASRKYIPILLLLPCLAFAQNEKTLKPWTEVFGTVNGQQLGTHVMGLTPTPNLPYRAAVSTLTKTSFFRLDSPTDTTALLTLTGLNPLVGDLNGDGYTDVVLKREVTFNDTVFIYWGTPTSIDTLNPLKIPTENQFDDLTTGFVGDINKDGKTDLLLRALNYGQSRGKVYLYYGPVVTSQASITVVGDSALYQLGTTIAVGDLNNDSYNDIIIRGSRESGPGKPNYDHVNIYWGKPEQDFLLRTEMKTGRTLDQGLACFDINGDGISDLAWTARDTDLSNWVNIHFGGASFDTIPNLRLKNPGVGDFGRVVINAGDMNGDGYDDIAVGCPLATITSGFVFVFSGGPTMDNLFDAAVGMSAESNLGWSVSTIGDMNSDGLNDIIVGGPRYAFYNDKGYWGIFLGDNTIPITTVKKNDSDIPSTFELQQNYPNPFNPRTTIEFKLSKRSHTVLIIYDSLGREIKSMLDREFEAGVHKVEWDGTDKQGRSVATGAYFYEIIVDGEKFITKKLVVVR